MECRMLLIIVCFSLRQVSLSALLTGKDSPDYDGPKLLSVNESNTTTVTPTATEPTTPAQLSINGSGLMLPLCSEAELVVFNGTDFTCLSIPERKCRCPEGPPVFPRPPPGCTVFEPPDRGAFVCFLVRESQIYCSVVCDDQSEFSNFPLNPYTCGEMTEFRWVDFTDVTQISLPQCSGFRHTVRPLYSSEFYFRSACSELSEEEADRVRMDFCDLVEYFTFDFIDCKSDEVFIQCGENSVGRK